MTRLPQLPWDQAVSRWAAIIDPAISSPIVNGRLIKDVDLIIGENVINHKLGRKLQGYLIVGIDGVAEIYDSQSESRFPELTLTLISDANVTVSLWVF